VENDILRGFFLEQRRSKSPLLMGLPQDGAVPLLVGDERLFDEEVSQTRHFF
jgi:hypothetical protein